ncbi:MAG: DUF3857 domain-containing protein, partial [Chitinophagales bacterium]
MFRKKTALVSTLLIGFFVTMNLFQLDAQSYFHADYDWEEEPSLSELLEEEAKESAIILKDKRLFEYAYNDKGELDAYETVHKIIRVNDDQAVENFNKVFVPLGYATEFVEIKARAINSEGKVTALNKDNIKELENVQNIGGLKIFAIEGAEKGGDVEYFYTTKSPMTNPYGREVFQSLTKIKEASIDIISPINLEFQAKGYNGFPELTLLKDEETQARMLSGRVSNIEPLIEEDYSSHKANLMRIDYTIAYNKGASGMFSPRIYGWASAADHFSGSFGSFGGAEEKAVAKLVKTLKLKKIAGEEAKIKTIEAHLKNTISVERGGGPEFTQIDKILTNKYASELGMIRLFIAVLQTTDIKHEIVMTSNRFDARFDKELESWNNFSDVILYIPQSKKYISPAFVQFRYGAAPYQFAGNYALFIADAQNYDVHLINVVKAEDNVNRIEANVNFDTDFNVDLDMEHGWTGYRAALFRTVYSFQKMEFIEDRVKSGMQDAKINNLILNNETMEDIADESKEFFIDSELEVASLIEKAGKSYLFKIG